MMHVKEKVLRKIKGKEEVVDFVFGSGILTANPPEIQDVKGYKVMRGFGFSIKFSNGKDKKPTYYALELWGNNAEHMARLGFEGQLIEVAGRETVKKYKNQQGEEKEVTLLVVDRFTVLSRKENGSNSDTNTDSENQDSNEEPTQEDVPTDVEEVNEEKDEFDDIPF